MLPYGRQSINEADIEAVVEVLKSDWLTTGPKVETFESKFAEAIGCRHAIAVSSGTAALHLAMLAAHVQPTDRVITSPNTFVATPNSAAFVGATPDFVDIDPVSYNLCPQSLQANWQPDTKAVIAVDYAGQSAEMPAIAEIARSNGAVVIEDACHAVGGGFYHEHGQYNVGNHPWADMTTFSFHPVKTMTTGEGGILATNDDHFAEKARLARSHGITRNHEDFFGLQIANDLESSTGPWYYEMHELGYNYRMTDIQCALGISQLSRLDSFVKQRRALVVKYNDLFQGTPHLITPQLKNENDRELTSWHLYTVQIDFEAVGCSRVELMKQLRTRGVGSQVLYIPVHLQPWYQKNYGYALGKCPVAEKFYSRAISLPLFPEMTEQDVEHVVSCVQQALNCTSKSAMVA